jgi:hypothetical protein
MRNERAMTTYPYEESRQFLVETAARRLPEPGRIRTSDHLVRRRTLTIIFQQVSWPALSPLAANDRRSVTLSDLLPAGGNHLPPLRKTSRTKNPASDLRRTALWAFIQTGAAFRCQRHLGCHFPAFKRRRTCSRYVWGFGCTVSEALRCVKRGA